MGREKKDRKKREGRVVIEGVRLVHHSPETGKGRLRGMKCSCSQIIVKNSSFKSDRDFRKTPTINDMAPY